MAEDIPSILWHGNPFFCHTRTNYRPRNWRQKAEANGLLCMGSLIASERFMAPPSPDADVREARAAALAYAEANPGSVDVMDVQAFVDHHRDSEIAQHWRAAQSTNPLLRRHGVTRLTVDSLKRQRDGHLHYGPRPVARQVFQDVRDPLTGHTFRDVGYGMGTVEYAPKDCTCDECAGRQR